jgi:hypothetical protein
MQCSAAASHTRKYLFAEFNPEFVGGCTSQNRRIPQPPSAFGVFAAHEMASARTSMLDFACCGDFDSFAQSLTGLLLRHPTSTSKKNSKRIAKQKGGSLRHCRLWVNNRKYKFLRKMARMAARAANRWSFVRA